MVELIKYTSNSTSQKIPYGGFCHIRSHITEYWSMHLGLKQLVGQSFSRPPRECTQLWRTLLIKCVMMQRMTCDAWTEVNLVHGVILSHWLMAHGWRGHNSKNATRNYYSGALLYRKHLCQKGRDDLIKKELYQRSSKSYAACSKKPRTKEWTLPFIDKLPTPPLLRLWQNTFLMPRSWSAVDIVVGLTRSSWKCCRKWNFSVLVE